MNTIKTNSARAWLLAARPKTLTGAAVPVMIGTALALCDTAFHIDVLPAVLCFLFAFIMQIDANFINDYFDFIRGNDAEERLGPLRACTQGWITPDRMRHGILLTTALACLAGLPLVWYGGPEMILVGAFCVLFCFLYTTRLSYVGMGDVLVLVFFGLVPVCMTYYLAVPSGFPRFTWECLWAAVACGMVIDTLLLVNNYRDIDNDRKAGKRTLAVALGSEHTRFLYLVMGLLAVLLGAVFAVNGHVWAACLPLLYLCLHVRTYQEMVKINKGKALNAILGKTARNMFVYGLLVSLGLLIG